MAAASLLQAIFLAEVVLICSGYFYNYGTYHYNSQWCPSGTQGTCLCSNDVVNCSSQGFTSVPQGLPSSTKQLLLGHNQISSINYQQLSFYPSLEIIDLRSNKLRSLPEGIFDALPQLAAIDLSDNPWECLCETKWILTWLQSAPSRGIVVLHPATTSCANVPSSSLLTVLPAQLGHCGAASSRARSPRSVSPQTSSPIHTFPDWSSVCTDWGFLQNQCNQSSLGAAACVLSMGTRNAALVVFSNFTSQTNIATCRNYCLGLHYDYYAFYNSTYNCMCGDEDTTAVCSGCDNTALTTSSADLCGESAYMRISSVYHVLAYVSLNFPSPVITHAPVTFSLSGFPSAPAISAIFWDFGDGARGDNLTVPDRASSLTVNHTFFYPGLFQVTATLCGSGVCHSVRIRVRVGGATAEASLSCPVVSEVSDTLLLNVSLTNVLVAEVNWSRSDATGTIYAGSCEKGWIKFNDRCIKYITNSQTFVDAEAICQNQGSGTTLLMLNSLEEGQQLLLGLTPASWIGAQHNGTMYTWTSSGLAATFLQALSVDRSAGNCLVMGSTGLVSASCTSQNYVLCQKSPTECPSGKQAGIKGHCFYAGTNPATASWQAARKTCQQDYGGDLATMSRPGDVTDVITTLNLTSSSWIGLESPDLPGHYSWVNGEAHSWGIWSASVVTWPCVALTKGGQFQPTNCDKMLRYICEYSINDKVTSDMHVAGTLDLQNQGSTFNRLTAYTQAPPSRAAVHLVLPGVWFAKEGELLEVNFQVTQRSVRNVVGIQVLRPTCSGSKVVIRPGCGQNIFAKCGTSSQNASCPITTCTADEEEFCPLTNSCMSFSSPCSCAGVSASPAYCSDTDSTDVSYAVIAQTLYELPTGSNGAYTARFGRGVWVRPYDVLAFQSQDRDHGLCVADAASKWKQVAFLRINSSWMNISRQVSLSSFSKEENYVCYMSVTYGAPGLASVPPNLAHLPSLASYTFQAQLVGSSTPAQTCLVESVQNIGDLKWLYPPASPNTAASGNLTVYVEARVQHDLVVMVTKGSKLVARWQLNGAGAVEKSTVAACPPAALAAKVADCLQPTSQLLQPFFIFSSFTAASPAVFTVNVSNPLQWKALGVVVIGVSPVQSLVLSHDSCNLNAFCRPLLEVGVPQAFAASIDRGTVDTYEYSVNGTIVLQASASASMSYTFPLPGFYNVTVRAVNGLGATENWVQVEARIKAGVQQPSLQPSEPVYAQVGTNTSFTLSAAAAKGSKLNITWSFGDGSTEWSVTQVGSRSVGTNNSHAYSKTGQYTLNVSLVDELGIAVAVSGTVEVLSPITNITVSASPQVVAAGNTTTFYIQILSGTFQNYGLVTYSLVYADGSAQDVYTSNQLSKSFDHVFSVNGTFNVCVVVENEVSMFPGCVAVIVQQCPNRIKLTYNGPKNVSDQLMFTAEVIKGSDIVYTFDFGDGAANLTQRDPVALHSYNSSNTYNVTVISSNDVCFVWETLNVIVMDANTLIVRKINHNRYAPVNQVVLFTVDVITINIQEVRLVWTTSVPATVTGAKDFNSSFTTVGDHIVTVNLTLIKNTSVTRFTSSVITIQEQVDKVLLTGPQLLSFNSSQAGMGLFTASSTGGTDVEYLWHNGTSFLPDTTRNITFRFTAAGLFNISVIAHNKVSEVGVWKLVNVQQAIENVTVTCQNCLNHRYLASGTQASLLCTYQGTSANISWLVGTYTARNGPIIAHSFFINGTQTVLVSVENLVSSQNVTFELILEVNVTGLKVTPSKPWVGEGYALTMAASVTQGTNIVYTWNCTGGQLPVNTTNGSFSVNFTSWGNHTCKVTAFNNVSSAQTSVSIKVLKPIDTLGIKNWSPNNTFYVPINKYPGVEAVCNTLFMVNLTWDVQLNGAVIPGGHLQGVWWDANFTYLTYKFPQAGLYQLQLTAKNEISNKSIGVKVEAQAEVTLLMLEANATAVVVGSAVQFEATNDSGTSLTFAWKLNGAALSNVGSIPSFVHSFSSAGTHIVQVTASNRISSQTANKTVLAQHPVHNITLALSASSPFDSNNPFVIKDQTVQFVANVSSGSDPVFEWLITSPSSQTAVGGASLVQAFSETGTYYVTVVVKNNVSQEVQTFTIYVEVPVITVDILVRPNAIVSTGQEVTFTAVLNKNATPVDYTWTVDGENTNTSGLTYLHTFLSAGLHEVKLLAQNNITKREQNLTIEALDPVSGLEMRGCNITLKVGVAGVLSGSAQGTGVTFSWSIQTPSKSVVYLGPHFPATFPAEGTYPVTLTAQNKVGQDNVTCSIKVQDAVSGIMVNIVHPPVDYIFTNQNVTFAVTGNHLMDAVYTWNLTSGVGTYVSSSATHIAVFSVAQSVQLTVTVSNDVSHAVASRNFTVQDLKCNLPTVTPVGDDTRSVLRSKSAQFDVYIDNKGCTQYTAVHAWRIYEAADCTLTTKSSGALVMNGVDMTRPTLILPMSLLPVARSTFCVHYTMGYQKTPLAEEVFYNLTVLSSPLVSIITGGGWRMADGTREVCLDGGLSYNPDDPSSGSAGMIFAWTCHSTPSRAACFKPVTNASSTFCLPSIPAGVYNISLTVYLSCAACTASSHSTSQRLEVKVQSPPILSVGVKCVSCQSIGDYRISKSRHTVLSAFCSETGSEVTYFWNVTEDGQREIHLDPQHTSTGTSASNLVVLRNTALKDGHSYKFTVTARSADGSRSESQAYIVLQPNLPPSGGMCTASPTVITVLLEMVTVTCWGWEDLDEAEAELVYEIKMEHGTLASESYLLYHGTRSTQAVYVAPWPGSTAGGSQLVVSVLDENGARTEALKQTITFRNSGIQSGSLSKDLFVAANTTMTTLLQQGDPVPLLQYTMALTQMLNSASTGSLPTGDVQVQALVRTAIIVCVSNHVPVETLQQAQQLAYLLSLLTEFSAEYQTSGCHTLTLRTLQSIASVLHSSVRPGLDREDFAFQSLYSSIFHLLQVVGTATFPAQSPALSVSFASLFPQIASLSSRFSSTWDLDPSKAAWTPEHKMKVVTEAFKLAENVTSAVLKSMVLDEESISFQVGGMRVEGERTLASKVGPSFYWQGGCRFSVPASMLSWVGHSEEVLKIMTMLTTNPYTWGYIHEHAITTAVPTLSFKYANGSDLPVSSLLTPVEIVMSKSGSEVANNTLGNGSLLQGAYYQPQAGAQFDTWTLPSGQSKKLLVDGTTNGTAGISALQVQVRITILPNSSDLVSGLVPFGSIIACLGAGFQASQDSYTDFKEITSAHMASGADHRHYTFFVSPSEFNKNTEYSITLINKDDHHNVNISATMYLTSCQYYDEASEQWSETGCSVSDESVPASTVCRCSHLTAFGGSSLVPISSIRFTDLAELKLGVNPVVMIAIGTILIIYMFGAIICRYLDRTDLRRISSIPLCGCDGEFKYLITVFTGRQIGAGTTAHVGIKLYGAQSKTDPRHLTKTVAFQRNSRDSFLIATDNELGYLHKVKVWHDNSGPSPAWYLTQIHVQDLHTGQRYVFPANTWLSLEVDEGKLVKEICAAGSEELRSFSHVFSSSLSHNMAERHMWLSIINRPDHSRFTRFQRASCCVTLVFLYMFVNAMWYGFVKDQSQKTDPISWRVIGWDEVIIALISTAIIFPFGLLLVFIFKRSHCKGDMFTQAMRPQSAQTLEIEAMCDVSQYGGSLRTMTPIDDWSALFERESTTESIPPISSQLRRTTAVTRSKKESSFGHGAFPGSGSKSSVQCIRRTQDLMWNQENILKSWPEKLPSFTEEEAAKTGSKSKKLSATEPTISASSAASGSAEGTIQKGKFMPGKSNTSVDATALKHSSPGKGATVHKGIEIPPLPPTSPTSKTAFKTSSIKTVSDKEDNEHEEFMQRLDEIDRQLLKSSPTSRKGPSSKSSASTSTASKTQQGVGKTQQAVGKTQQAVGKKLSSKPSHGALEDLFESDDEWCSETHDAKDERRGSRGSAFNPHTDPALDRRTSQTSLMRLRIASMHVPGSAGSSFLRQDSTCMRRDSTLNSFMMSEKSRTTLSAIIRTRVPMETSGCRLPWYCVFIGYALCLCLSVVCILLVLLYGYNFGPAVALEWLLSVLLAFFGSIFVLEPLKVLMLTLYVAVITKDAESDVESDSIDILPSIEANEQLKEVKFRPLGGFALLQARDEGRKKQRLRTMFRQAIAYLLLTATVLAVTNIYYGPAVFQSAKHIENTFVHTRTAVQCPTDFLNVNSTERFWAWARDVFTPALYRHQLASAEHNPVLLGPARLRQIRSTTVGCLTNTTRGTRLCLGQLQFHEDSAPYNPGWSSVPTGNASWLYSTADQLQTRYKFGQDHLYSGGGYVVELGTSYNQTLNSLQQLENSHWLDRRSRALFVEWTMYSAAEDLFSAVTLLLELPISGGVLAKHEIMTERLCIFDHNKVDPIYICQVLLLIPAVYLLIQSLLTLAQQKCKFVLSPGNWLQLLVALLALASVSLYAACVVTATDVARRFSVDSVSFTNFERIVDLHEVLRLLHACLLLLLFLKIVGQIRYIRPLSVFLHTLASAFSRLAGATFIFLVLLLTYTQLGYLFYGSFVRGFRSFQSSLLSMFGVMKGSMDFTPALEFQPIFSHFFFCTFYMFVYGLFVALVIAILQDAYKMTRSHLYFKSSLEPQDYEMIEFMLKRFKLWAGIIKPKPAFRKVKFEGLPSLPSRGSSSATSSRPASQTSRERRTPTPDLIASMSAGGDALDRLLPAWEKLLSLLGTMEKLEKEEQKLMGSVQSSFKRWNSEHDKKNETSGSTNSCSLVDKPPIDRKNKLSRFRSNFHISTRKFHRHVAVTPESSSNPNSSPAIGNKPIVRTLSDRGMPDNFASGVGAQPRPGSDTPGDRRRVSDSLSASSGITDTFPGSASQVRPKISIPKSGPDSALSSRPANSSNHKAPASSSGPSKAGSDPVHRPDKSSDKTAEEDSKQQAWES